MYRTLILLLLCGSAMAHEFTPTYPELRPSYVPGVLRAEMFLFNARKDVRYYEISVYDKDWNTVPFAGPEKVIPIAHLERKKIDVYIRQADRDRVVYICSRSKILTGMKQSTVVSSKICSKIR